ncbi:acyl-CoA dehydrogenase family protein [Advenella sp. RU8]|uniref:acyl-CoA dehydrogenase family protein n=1 Tax=Advenella sp. RU8 TaxID=3399575 RepID=UPI003AABB570
MQGNNIPDSRGSNYFRMDPYSESLLRTYLKPDLFAHLLPVFDRLGQQIGDSLDELADIADKNPPVLTVRKRNGTDGDRIHKHPAYIELEKVAYAQLGLAAMSHRKGVLGWNDTFPPAAKYALSHLFVQAEFGLCCPVSMTDSLARTLKKYGDPELVEQVLPQVASQDFDQLQQGAMFMTEQAAGSDVSATQTLATLVEDGSWRLSGDKWFCSNPDAGFAMVLARSEEAEGLKGVSLFLLPKIKPDGTPNHYRLLRLKDKLGTRSMASGEIRLEGAFAWLVGERGRGFQQMADMINNSRLSNGMRAAGLMRRAVSEAIYFSQHRTAFGKRLIEMPLMQRQLVKMIMRAEQGRSVMFQTAQALERADNGEQEGKSLVRILTPLIKFRACRDARTVTGDAMEVRGGCGYIEEWTEPRLLRDAHLGSIWEGTSNIVALDVLRAIQKSDGLAALKRQTQYLLENGMPCKASLRDLQTRCIENAFALAARAAGNNTPEKARQVGTALYNLISMAAMRWEAEKTGMESRNLLADQVLLHRLASKDPLAEKSFCEENAAILAYAL